MSDILFANNASALLNTTITDTDGTIEVAAGFGTLFPSPSGNQFFYASLEDDSGNYEVVRCTSRSGDLLTVTRGQDNTTAQAFTQNVTRVELRLTAAVLNSVVQVTGAVMTGDIDFDGNQATDAVIDGPLTQILGGEIVGVPLRGTSGLTSNEIAISGSNPPTIGGAAILKTGDDIVAELDTAGTIILDSATTGVRIPSNGFLRVEGGTTGEYFGVDHDDTDVNIVCAGAEDLNIFSLTGDVRIGAGIGLVFTPGGANNENLVSPNIMDFSFESQTYAAATTVNVDYELGSYVTINLSSTQLTNLNITNVPGKFAAVRFKIVQDGTGGRDITNWPGTDRWPGGTAPTLSSMGANESTFIDMWTDNGGTTWYGSFSATLDWS